MFLGKEIIFTNFQNLKLFILNSFIGKIYHKIFGFSNKTKIFYDEFKLVEIKAKKDFDIIELI